MGPEVRGRGHDIEVGEQEQRLAAGAVTAKPGDDRAATRELVRLDDLARDARVAEVLRDVAGGEDLVAGRVDADDPDQVPEGLDQVVVGVLPRRLVECA